MDILSISPLPMWTVAGKGGAPSIYFFQKGLVKKGHKAVYLHIPLRRSSANRYQSSEKEGITVLEAPSFLLQRVVQWRGIGQRLAWLVYNIYALYVWLKHLRGLHFRVVIGYTYFSAPACYIISKCLGVPYIFREVGSMALHRDVNSIRGRLRRAHELVAYRIPASCYVLTDDGTNTQYVAQKMGIPSSKIHFLKNGRFQFQGVANEQLQILREKHKIGPRALVVVAAGRIEAGKYFEVIADSIMKLVESDEDIEIKAFLIGTGFLKTKLETQVQEAGFHETVIFPGGLTHDELFSYYHIADVVLALGSINPLTEGMSLGKCVVTLDLGATSRFIRNGETGILLRRADLDDVSDAIRCLAVAPNLRDEIGENARRWANQNLYTWNRRIQHEIAILESVSNRGE